MGARTRGIANNILTSGKVDSTDGLSGAISSSNIANASVTNVTELPPSLGSTVQSVAGNPAAPVAEGKIWYNTSTDNFNIAASLEAWSSGSPLITARYGPGGCGTQDAFLAFGGAVPTASPIYLASSEEYNGSGWSSGGNLNLGRYIPSGIGTQTAGVAVGGDEGPTGSRYVSNVEHYDGSTWTAATAFPNPLGIGGGNTGGVQTAGWLAGGREGPAFTNVNDSYNYDGSTWTVSGNQINIAGSAGASGPQTAGWIAGGSDGLGSLYSASQFYDGSSWTAGPNINTARSSNSGSGTNTNALIWGGQAPGDSAATENYDGTAWATSPATLSTAKYLMSRGQQPSGDSALAAGGRTSPTAGLTTTEEYNSSILATTAAAWASGGNLNSARKQIGGTGTQTAAVAFAVFKLPLFVQDVPL